MKGFTMYPTLILLSQVLVAQGHVYNLHLVTDNVPDYTDMSSLAHSTADLWQTPQDKAIAVWRWGRRSRRQTSCATEDGRTIWDPILHYNSYGAMNCGIISSLNIASWLQLGFHGRYIQLGDHTVSEVSWDEGKTWHLFDSSMSIFCYNHKGVVASCDEIQQAHACELSDGKSERGHFYYYHFTPPCGSHFGPTGWRFACDNPVENQRTLFNGADSYMHNFSVDRYCQYARTGHRYTLGIRPYESYTRYWEPLDRPRRKVPMPPSDPDYFRPVAKGFSEPDDPHGPMDIRGNGQWVFQPDLAAKNWREYVYDDAGLVAEAGGRPRLHPAEAGRPAWAVFKISAANVITSLRIEGEALRRTAGDALKISISRNAGICWLPVWGAETMGPLPIRLSLRKEVAGVTQCLVKVEILAAAEKRAAGLDSLKFTTITQLNRRTLPSLALGANQVMLWADEQLETTEIWPALHGGAYRETAAEELDAWSDTQPDGFYKSTLGAGVNGKPCSVTWKLTVPSEIHDVFYGAVSTNHSSQSYVSLQHSWDGKRFSEFDHNASAGFPMDKQVHHFVSGRDVPAGVREAYFRSVFFCNAGAATYNAPGIQDLILRVRHKPRNAAFQPIEVTYHWTEHRASGDLPRSHTELVGALPHRWTINVAGRRDPTMDWVRINLQGCGTSPPAGYGYSDGEDVGESCAYRRVTYRWGKELAHGKSYTASRPSSTASGNPDSDGRELTNGIIIAPTDYMTSQAIQPATAFWDAGKPVRFIIDLGATQKVGGIRVWTHQPNDRYCHPQRIEVAVSADGQVWQSAGTIHHDDLWKPPGDFEPWEHDDDPRYDRLSAGGRLAYGYPLALEKPLAGRYVRLICTPQEGKGMGLSEFQIFDAAKVLPWPGNAALPAIATHDSPAGVKKPRRP